MSWLVNPLAAQSKVNRDVFPRNTGNNSRNCMILHRCWQQGLLFITNVLNIKEWRISLWWVVCVTGYTVADPGFPRRGGGRQRPRWGRQPTILPNFYRKLHENERIWTPSRGARVPGAPPNGVFTLAVSGTGTGTGTGTGIVWYVSHYTGIRTWVRSWK